MFPLFSDTCTMCFRSTRGYLGHGAQCTLASSAGTLEESL